MGLQKIIWRWFIWFALTLTACSGFPDRETKALGIAEQAGFTRQIISSGLFSFTTFRKLENNNDDLLVVYIEGDGFAFQRKGQLSPDPTPQSAVALELAAKDPHPSVMYIARPCQYLPHDALKECDPKYWSTHRYAEDVIAAIDGVIDHAASGYKNIALVGYSGGGTVAALIAARRQDVAWLITIAANLDHQSWTNLHQITPLSGSLNAADYAASIQNLPQLHLTGAKDKIVPFEVTEAFLNRMTNHSRVIVRTVPQFDHECCWVRDWPEPACMLNGYAAYCVR
ncbi:MAG: alpha/beta hydrolase [Nitrosomonadales bacterium]|nr:MAG: alpha/beta hydrolase [Nitrosomonadales bacterium]